MDPETESKSAYAVVAVIAFLAGLALAQMANPPEPGHSRIDWPKVEARPRALQP